MIHRASRAVSAGRASDMLATAVPYNIAPVKTVVTKPGSQPNRLQTASSRTPVSGAVKGMPRYAQPTQSASSRTTPPLTRRITIGKTQNMIRSEPADSAHKTSNGTRQKQLALATLTLKSKKSSWEASNAAKAARSKIRPQCTPKKSNADGAPTTRSFAQMIVGSKIPIAKARLYKTPRKTASTPARVQSILKTRSVVVQTERNARKAKFTTTKLRSTSPAIPATSTSKAVRFSEQPSEPRVFDPNEPPVLSGAEYDGEWIPRTRETEEPWRTYSKSSVAQGGKNLFLSVSAGYELWTLQDMFLSRFKSVQGYEQRREASEAPASLVPQREYGTTFYKVLLQPTRAIESEHLGLLQLYNQMGTKLPASVDTSTPGLCLVFGAFEKIEQTSFKTTKIPETVAPACLCPVRWPATKSEKRLEQWVNNVWPLRLQGDFWDDTIES